MLVRYIYCALVLAAFLWALNYMLKHSFAAWGFWPGFALCVSVGCAFIALAFAWDRYERNRSPKSQP
jgi:hypothetical protein